MSFKERVDAWRAIARNGGDFVTHVLEAEKQLESEEEFKQTLTPQQVSNYVVALIKA
jgi:hypothetical protein